MYRNTLMIGLVFSLVSVLLGAFGAHALKAMLTLDRLSSFETGVRYQFMHGAALIMLSLYISQNKVSQGLPTEIIWTARFFTWGVFCFSGSLYLFTLFALFNWNSPPLLGLVTPIGGFLFMLGWISWVRVVLLNKVDK